jgi:hypothetical protein
MKTIVAVAIVLFSFSSFAQFSGINYKALIKDTNGNVVSNTSTTIEFTIYKGAATFNTYRETHTIFTDINGVLISNIGEGTIVNGVFNAINWSEDDYFLGVKIDTGTGYVDLGITAFKSVPYALIAKNAVNAETAHNVTGLEALDESNGIGWRLKGRSEFRYGNIGENAIDFSYNSSSSDTHGATGEYAFASGYLTTASGQSASAFGTNTSATAFNASTFGRNTTASGNEATAFGNATTASGLNASAFGTTTIASGIRSTSYGQSTMASGSQSTAFGDNTEATGENAFALGYFTDATGENSTAIGYFTKAPSFSEFTIGINNTAYTPASQSVFEGNDRLFVIGNGNISSQSDALIVKKNGTITAPSLDIAEITDDKALITKEYADLNLDSSGLEAINEGNGNGWRLIGRNPNNYGNIGYRAIDLSFTAIPSTTSGATGNYSIALGQLAAAQGNNSFAGGIDSNTIAESSTAIGYGTKAQAYFSSAFGMYNLGLGSSTSYINTDPILEIGNGFGDADRRNALTILKNGKVGITTATPVTKLQITGGSDVDQLNDNSGYLVIGDVNNSNLVLDDNEIMARDNGSNTHLFLQNTGGSVAIGNVIPDAKLHIQGGNDASMANGSGFVVIGDLTGQNMVIDQNEIMARLNGANTTLHLQYEGGNVTVGGILAHSSDRRLKRNIRDLNYGLKEILQLQPKQYFWKNRTDQGQESLGLIAQDVQKIIANIVHEDDDDKKTLSVSYTELIPVLINALKEQQAIINKQSKKYSNLLARIEALETKNKPQNEVVIEIKDKK